MNLVDPSGELLPAILFGIGAVLTAADIAQELQSPCADATRIGGLLVRDTLLTVLGVRAAGALGKGLVALFNRVGLKGPTLDLFGGKVSQIVGAINVDLVATQGVRASVAALPFKSESIGEIIVNGPRAPFLAEVARVLQPGGRIIINATKGNKFGRLPSNGEFSRLGLKVIQNAGTLGKRFSGQVFRRTDGTVIPASSIRTTVLEKIR